MQTAAPAVPVTAEQAKALQDRPEGWFLRVAWLDGPLPAAPVQAAADADSFRLALPPRTFAPGQDPVPGAELDVQPVEAGRFRFLTPLGTGTGTLAS